LPIEEQQRLGLALQPIPEPASTTDEETSEEEQQDDDAKNRYVDDMPPLENAPYVVENPPPLPFAPPPRIQIEPPPILPAYNPAPPPIDVVRAHFNTYVANARAAVQHGDLNSSLLFTISNLQRLLQESEQTTPFIQEALASLPAIPRRVQRQRRSAQNIARIMGRRGVRVQAPPVVPL